LVASIFFIGCGGLAENLPEFNPVTGTVRLDGQPLPNARVAFLPETGPASGAITDDAGKYELRHKSGEMGAVAGTHRVEITTDLDGTGVPGAEKVLAKYNTASTLSVTVQPGDNTHDFDLKSK